MPPIKDILKGMKNPYARRREPLWLGPTSVDTGQGGVTQGLLSRYLACKERFRVKVIDGLAPPEGFNPRIEFGNLWHAAEEAHAAEVSHFGERVGTTLTDEKVNAVALDLSRRYPMARQEVDHWRRLAMALFPHYAEHWRQHPDVVGRTPLLQEYAFHVPYKLGSGRIVYLRGKWDSVDLVTSECTCGGNPKAGHRLDCKRGRKAVWLQENKTKSGIHVGQLTSHLKFDLQTMVYLVALDAGLCPTCRGDYSEAKRKFLDEGPGPCPNCGGKPAEPYLAGVEWKARPGYPQTPIAGVRYNVVRRPTHKTVDSALKKLDDDRRAGRIGEWFTRLNVEVSADDLARFRRTCLDPVLENLCDDYEWWESCHRGKYGGDPYDYGDRSRRFPDHQARHYRTPYHYDPLMDGGGGGADLDNHLDTGSRVGLVDVKDLFPELRTGA